MAKLTAKEIMEGLAEICIESEECKYCPFSNINTEYDCPFEYGFNYAPNSWLNIKSTTVEKISIF